MNYAEKLRQFNSTEKYRSELELLGKLVPMGDLLDYGSGLGTAAKYLSWYRSGKRTRTNKVWGVETGYYFKESGLLPPPISMKFDCVYFMHSIAHIESIGDVLTDIRSMLTENGEVIVITPNKTFLNKVSAENYTPDPTVIRHYEMSDLISLFTSNGYKVKTCGKFGQEFHGEEPERLFLVAGL